MNLYLSLSLPRPSDGKSQSLVTASPPDGNGTSLAQRVGTHARSLDLRGLRGLRIRGPHPQHRDTRAAKRPSRTQKRTCLRPPVDR